MQHDDLVDRFSQTVGVEKADQLVRAATTELGIEPGGTYSPHEVVDVCETIERSHEGYIRLVATEIRAHRQASRRFEGLLDEISDPVVTVGFSDGVPFVRNVNPAFVDTFGYDDVAGEPLSELIVPAGERDAAVDNWLRAGETDDVQVDRLTADGERRTFLFRPVIVSREHGTIEGYGIYTDITERTRRERQLAVKNEQLDRFASVVSHDLRNPLQVIQTRVELLLDGELSGDVREQLEAVDTAAGRMNRLIDKLLSLARQGQVVDTPGPVQFADVVHRAWSSAETPAATLAFDDDGTVVSADGERLRELLENLFRNAVEHGTEPSRSRVTDDGSVLVRVGILDEPSGFFVEDDGPGIAEDERDAVFDHGFTTDPDGTGLGLAIVEAIAEAHDWRVTVTESANGGARFEITNVDLVGDDG